MDIESILFDVEHFSSLLSYVNSKDEITKYVNDLSFKINSYIEEGMTFFFLSVYYYYFVCLFVLFFFN